MSKYIGPRSDSSLSNHMIKILHFCKLQNLTILIEFGRKPNQILYINVFLLYIIHYIIYLLYIISYIILYNYVYIIQKCAELDCAEGDRPDGELCQLDPSPHNLRSIRIRGRRIEVETYFMLITYIWFSFLYCRCWSVFPKRIAAENVLYQRTMSLSH